MHNVTRTAPQPSTFPLIYSSIFTDTTLLDCSTHRLNGQNRRSKILCRGQHILAQQRAHQRIQTQSLHTLDFMQVRVRGLGSHTRRARNRPSKGHPAPNRRRW